MTYLEIKDVKLTKESMYVDQKVLVLLIYRYKLRRSTESQRQNDFNA